MTIPIDAPPEPEVRMIPRYVCPRCGIGLEDPEWYRHRGESKEPPAHGN